MQFRTNCRIWNSRYLKIFAWIDDLLFLFDFRFSLTIIFHMINKQSPVIFICFLIFNFQTLLAILKFIFNHPHFRLFVHSFLQYLLTLNKSIEVTRLLHFLFLSLFRTNDLRPKKYKPFEQLRPFKITSFREPWLEMYFKHNLFFFIFIFIF